MGWSGYVWQEPPSMTAMKYQRQPGERRALQPGERFSVCREMENSVRWELFTRVYSIMTCTHVCIVL